MLKSVLSALRRRAIPRRLEEAFAEAWEEDIDLDSDRVVILSDQHRGVRDPADDFAACEENYAAALGYYLEAGYGLMVLGDAEELWENERPRDVLGEYEELLELEARFHSSDQQPENVLRRYERFWGNHDDPWRDPEQVKECLHELYPGLSMREGLKLRVVRGGVRGGLLFLAHGHQGTLDSDRFAWLARPTVRYVWRWLQRTVGFRSVTPARDYELRAEHERAMFAWARDRDGERPLLITGHTHRPVFMRLAPPGRARSSAEIESELTELKTDPSADREKVALLAAELELVRTAERRAGERSHRELPLPTTPPCYFNTGACSFADGTITGIELADGQIRLVRWQTTDVREGEAPQGDAASGGRGPLPAARRARPERKILEHADLAEVLQAVER